MFGIIDENKKFILLDDNFDRLRQTALLLVKEQDGKFIPMFSEETVDSAIQEYQETDIQTSESGEKYLK